MPTELLAIPPAYTLVGLYRLLTDRSLRDPVWAKVKHAVVRGAVVGALYASLGWKIMDWFVRRYVVRGRVGERVTIGAGSVALSLDFVFYSHLLLLLPQLGAIMHFFVKKNLRIARARAYALTVASRKKPAEFWSQGYVEEWQQPPVPTPEQKRAWGARKHQEKWLRILLFFPTQMIIKNFILLPLSPMLPLITPIFFSALRALQAGEILHKPYFTQKKMTKNEVWTWLEERKWAYRAFGFTASFLETFPVIGLVFSVSNRIGAAMWAHDLEKRQHLFGHGILQRLPPSRVGLFGCGSPMDITPAVVKAEKEIEARWSARPAFQPEEHVYDPAKPEADYPDTKPPSYEDVVHGATAAVASAPAAATGPSEAIRRVPPPLPPRHEDKVPGAF